MFDFLKHALALMLTTHVKWLQSFLGLEMLLVVVVLLQMLDLLLEELCLELLTHGAQHAALFATT